MNESVILLLYLFIVLLESMIGFGDGLISWLESVMRYRDILVLLLEGIVGYS